MSETFDLATAKKTDLLAHLQQLGVEANPQATNDQLRKMVEEKTNARSSFAGLGAKSTTDSAPILMQPSIATAFNSDMSQILGHLSTLVNKIDSLDERMTHMETGGVNDFKKDARQEDIDKAAVSKEGVNPRIVQIVENTLGVDFGVRVVGNKENPGSLLTILVPRRLSHVPMSHRPVVDLETGDYKIDPKTKRIVEEEYWPGDERSVALGATDSYDVIQTHANRVRSFIMAYYQKMNKPQPEFKTR